MDVVTSFNSELSSVYDCKPPISKAKMSNITKGAIRAIKYYKHVVLSVEKFIQKCRPEYKVPGLYVIDSIVRQSKHQFGHEKDVFGPRFARNVNATFYHLYKCHPDEKSRIIRVLNLWQKNKVFSPEVIQPLFDLADPNHPLHKEIQAQLESTTKGKPGKPPAAITIRGDLYDGEENEARAPPPEPAVDQSVIQQLQQLQQLLVKHQEASQNNSQPEVEQVEPSKPERHRETREPHQQRNDPYHVKFNKKLLDFDYGDEEDEDEQREGHRNYHGYRQPPPPPQPEQPANLDTALSTLLSNPELMKQLQSMTGLSQQPQSSPVKKGATPEDTHTRSSRRFQQEEDQFNREIQHNTTSFNEVLDGYGEQPMAMPPNSAPSYGYPPMPQQMDLSRPPPGFGQHGYAGGMSAMNIPQPAAEAPPPMGMPPGGPPPRPPSRNKEPEDEIDLSRDDERSRDHRRSRSRSDSRSRSSRKRRRSGSRSRSDRDRDRRRHRSRSRSGSRSRRSRRRSRSRERDRDRDHKRERTRNREEDEKEKERERERQKKGLPPMKKEHLSVCSTTLWVGHLSNRVGEEDLSDLFREYGTINDVNVILPRGCAYVLMNRRQDASKILYKLRNHKLMGKPISIAWAPGKGMKEPPFKDYWEGDVGTSYIPWDKIDVERDMPTLEQGGMLDEETLPPWIQKPAPPAMNMPPMNIVPQDAPNMGGLPPFPPMTEAPGALDAPQMPDGPPRMTGPTLLPPFLMHHNLPPGAGLPLNLMGLQPQLGGPIHAPPPPHHQLVMPHGLLQHPGLPAMPPTFQPQAAPGHGPAPTVEMGDMPMETDEDSRGKENSSNKSFGDMDIQEVTPDRHSREDDRDRATRKSRWEREDRDKRERDRDDKRRDRSRDTDREKGRDRREEREKGRSNRWEDDGPEKEMLFRNPDNPKADEPEPDMRMPDAPELADFTSVPPPFPPPRGPPDMFMRGFPRGMRGRGRFPPPFQGRGFPPPMGDGFNPMTAPPPTEGFNPMAFGGPENMPPPPIDNNGWGRGGPFPGRRARGMRPWGPDRGMRGRRGGFPHEGFYHEGFPNEPPLMDGPPPEREDHPWKSMMEPMSQQPPAPEDEPPPEREEHPWKAMMESMSQQPPAPEGGPPPGREENPWKAMMETRSQQSPEVDGDAPFEREEHPWKAMMESLNQQQESPKKEERGRNFDKNQNRESKFGDRDNKATDRDGRGGDRDNKATDRDGRSGDRDNKATDRDSRGGDRDVKSRERDSRGDRDSRHGGDRDSRHGSDRDSRGGDRDSRHGGDRDSRYGSDRDSRRGERDSRHGGDRDSRGGDRDRGRDRDSRGRDARGYDRDSRGSDRDRGRGQRSDENDEQDQRRRGWDRDRGRDAPPEREPHVNPWAELIQQMQQGGGMQMEVPVPDKSGNVRDKGRGTDSDRGRERDSDRGRRDRGNKNAVQDEKLAKEVEKHESEKEAKPLDEKEVKPVDDEKAKPEGDQEAKPLDDKESKPVDDKESKPVDDKESKPVDDKESKPVDDKESKPVDVKESKPVDDKESKPVDDKESKPVDDKESKPVDDKESKPVHDKESKPVDDKEFKPVDDQEVKSVDNQEAKSEAEPEAKIVAESEAVSETIMETNQEVETESKAESTTETTAEGEIDNRQDPVPMSSEEATPMDMQIGEAAIEQTGEPEKSIDAQETSMDIETNNIDAPQESSTGIEESGTGNEESGIDAETTQISTQQPKIDEMTVEPEAPGSPYKLRRRSWNLDETPRDGERRVRTKAAMKMLEEPICVPGEEPASPPDIPIAPPPIITHQQEPMDCEEPSPDTEPPQIETSVPVVAESSAEACEDLSNLKAFNASDDTMPSCEEMVAPGTNDMQEDVPHTKDTLDTGEMNSNETLAKNGNEETLQE